MSFPEDLPQNARFWPKSRIDELRAMASKDAPSDPAERERQHQWFREFARDAPAWMAVESEQADLAAQLIELRAYAQGMLARINEMLSAFQQTATHQPKEVEGPAYTELKQDIASEGTQDRMQWNWLQNMPGPKSATVDGNHKLKTALAKMRQREASAQMDIETLTSPAPTAQPAQSANTAPAVGRQLAVDAAMAELAAQHGMEVAVHVRQSFSSRHFSVRDIRRKMGRFVGVFRSPHSASTALAARLELSVPNTKMVSWMKERAEVVSLKTPNHYAVWLGAHGRGRKKKKAIG